MKIIAVPEKTRSLLTRASYEAQTSHSSSDHFRYWRWARPAIALNTTWTECLRSRALACSWEQLIQLGVQVMNSGDIGRGCHDRRSLRGNTARLFRAIGYRCKVGQIGLKSAHALNVLWTWLGALCLGRISALIGWRRVGITRGCCPSLSRCL